jgi:lipid II:glycine glycyltransferase (peptidoglycan interpeptide bridge formation enzyme)
LPSKTKNQIRKSHKSGILYKNIETSEELQECKLIYDALITKHDIKNPYVKNIFDHLFCLSKKNKNIVFRVAKLDQAVIAYSVFLKSPSQLFYWLNASNPCFSSLNPTSGLLSLAIEDCCADVSLAMINLGAVPAGNDGLLHFKKNWGAVEMQYGFFYSPAWRLWEIFNEFMGK